MACRDGLSVSTEPSFEVRSNAVYKAWTNLIASVLLCLTLCSPFPTQAQMSRAESARSYRERGHDWAAKGDWERAISDYTFALNFEPSAPNHYNRALAYYHKANFTLALADLDRALTLDPRLIKAWIQRGLTRTQTGDVAGASRDLSQAITLDPKNAFAWHNRGSIRRLSGDLAGALSDYEQAIRYDGNLAAVWHNRGEARQEQGDLKGALSDFNQALKLDSQFANAWNSRASLRLQTGDLTGVVADATRAIALNPQTAEAWLNRGLAYWRQGLRARAERDFTQGLALSPGLKTRLERELKSFAVQ